MKRQGFFTGNIYDEDYPVKDIKECYHQLSDAECTEEKNQERHMKDLLEKCAGCAGCPESQKCIKSKIVSREFNAIGEKITIQLKYEDLEVSQLPKTCIECPVGFMSYNCGRKVPLTVERPDSCKLKVIKILPE